MALPYPKDDGGGDIGGGGTPTPTPSPTPTPTPSPSAPSVPPAPAPPPTPTAPQIVGSTVNSDTPLTVTAVDLIAVPAQRLAVQLGQQPCTVAVYQKTTGLYLDLAVADVPIVNGALCLEGVFIVRDAYLGFTGDLIFVDTEGSDDPDYTGLGSRWSMLYLAPAV